MKIQQAVLQDLVEILYLVKVCVSDMNEKGQKHWNNAYPGANYLLSCIENNTLFLCRENEVAKGMIILSKDEPEEYKPIDWQGKSDKVLFIRFLAVHPLWQGKGIAKKLVAFAEEYSKKNAFSSIRMDIYSGIEGAFNFCSNMGFNQTGQFHSKFQQNPYLAFEKSL